MTDNLRAALIRVFSLDSNPGVLVVRARPEALADEVIRELSAQGVALASPKPLVAPATGEGLDRQDALVTLMTRYSDHLFSTPDTNGHRGNGAATSGGDSCFTDLYRAVIGMDDPRETVATLRSRLAATTLDPGEADYEDAMDMIARGPEDVGAK